MKILDKYLSVLLFIIVITLIVGTPVLAIWRIIEGDQEFWLLLGWWAFVIIPTMLFLYKSPD